MDNKSKAVVPLAEVAHQEVTGQQLPAVVTQHDEDGFLARWSDAVPVTFTNLDQRGRDGIALVTRALASCERTTRNVVNQPLELVGYVAHRAEVTDQESGEIQGKDRAVMVLADGTLVSTMSGAVLRTLAYLSRVMGRGKWTPPIRVMVREHKLEAGRSYCDMIVMDSPASEVVTGPRKKA